MADHCQRWRYVYGKQSGAAMTYGCFDREPFKYSYVMHGISKVTGNKVLTVIPFRMARECQYTLNDKYADPGCVGCSHKSTQPEMKS